MKPRDRMMLAAIAAFVVIVGGWMEVVSPEQAKVSKAQAKVESATQQLQNAEGELSQARSAQAKYAEAYASIVRLGKAVPAQQEVPALVYELERAANTHHVEFASITNSASASAGGSSSKSAASAGAQPAGFMQMPFTFAFTGSFADLYHLLTALQGLASYNTSAGLDVSGRLLTIQSLNLVPTVQPAGGEVVKVGTGGKQSQAKPSAPGEHLTGTIIATAYVLPPSVGLTGGASPSGPSGSGAVPASSGSGSSTTPATSATIKAAP
jgi:hypothetical protein